MRPQGTAQELANRRRLAVQRVRDGYTVAEVATFLGTTERSVYRWLAAAREYGDRAGLNPRPHRGPKPRLDVGQQARVIDLLDERPTAHGFATDLWTAPRVAQLILRRFGVRYHPRYVNAWLRQRGVRSIKPRKQAREQDPEAVQRWLSGEWLSLLQEARADGGWLAFVDEAGLLMGPLWRRTQARRGHPPCFGYPAVHRRKVSALAAMAWSPVRQEYRLLAWTMADGCFDSAAVATVLRELAEELPGQVRVVWDRGGMHKGEPIRQAKADLGGRLVTAFLPAYTPEANPTEQLWSLLKYSRLANFVPRNLTHLNIRACQELDALAACPHLLEGCFAGTILPRGTTLTLAA